MERDLLKEGLTLLRLGDDRRLESGLRAYIAAIEEWNPAYGLVGAYGDELVIKHILDSLAPLATLDELAAEALAARGAEATERGEAMSLADMGTGAGLPGIPLALAKPGWRVSLVDRMTRRINFLKAMQESLGLSNAEIVEMQVEHYKGRHELVTFRAFRPFERKLFKKVFASCAPWGYVVAYKGKADKASAELAEIEGLYRTARIEPVSVPFLDDERCLVILSPAPRG